MPCIGVLELELKRLQPRDLCARMQRLQEAAKRLVRAARAYDEIPRCRAVK